jgi:hypothetical protein
VSIAGLHARVITPICYLATKLEAFRGRGNDDYSGSHDQRGVARPQAKRPRLPAVTDMGAFEFVR